MRGTVWRMRPRQRHRLSLALAAVAGSAWAPAQASGGWEARLAQGDQAFERGAKRDAMGHYLGAYQAAKAARSWVGLGRVSLHTGDLRVAAGQVGKAYGDYQRARKAYEKVLRLESMDGAWGEDQVRWLKKVTAAKPRDWGDYERLLGALGRTALQVADRARGAAPEKARQWAARGAADLRRLVRVQAFRLGKRNTQVGWSYSELARAYAAAGQEAKSRQAFERSLAILGPRLQPAQLDELAREAAAVGVDMVGGVKAVRAPADPEVRDRAPGDAELQRLEVGASVAGLAFAGDQDLLVSTGGPAGSRRIYDAASGALRAEVAQVGLAGGPAALAPGGATLWLAGVGKVHRVAASDLGEGAPLDLVEPGAEAAGAAPVVALAVHPRGEWVAVAPAGQAGEGGDAQVWIVDARSGARSKTLEVPSDAVTALAVSASGTELAVGMTDGPVLIYEVTTWDQLSYFEGHSRAVRALAFSPGGSLLASASEDGAVKVWQVGGDRLQENFEHGVDARPGALAFGPGDQRLTYGCSDGSVHVRELRGGREVASWKGHGDAVTQVAVHPAGRWIATGGVDELVKVWRAP